MKWERIWNANVIYRTEVYWISIQIVNMKNFESESASENESKNNNNDNDWGEGVEKGKEKNQEIYV